MPAFHFLYGNEKSEYVCGTLEVLAEEDDVGTLATLAVGMHEVSKSLRHRKLRNNVIRAMGTLFMDENAQVRKNAMGQCSQEL